MARVLNIFKILALAACTVCLVFISILAHKATTRIPDLNPTVVKMNTAVDGLNTALITINRPKTGTLAEVGKSILAFKSVLTHADMALNHEDQNLTALDAQERALFSNTQQVFSDAHTTLTGASTLFATTNQTVAAVQPVLTHLDAAVVSGNETVTRVNLFFASPTVTSTMKSVDKITFHAANIMDTADQVSAKASHSYLHPPTNPWARAWDASSAYVLPILKIAASVAP